MATYNITILGTSDTTGYKFSGTDKNGIIDTNAYDPTITIDDGDSIAFIFNQGALSHPFQININGQNIFGNYAGGDSGATWTPSEDGAWTYVCTSHGTMVGTINVLSNTSSATTTTAPTAPPATTTTVPPFSTTTTAAPVTTTTVPPANTTTVPPVTTTTAPSATTTPTPTPATTATPEDSSCNYPFLQDRIKQFSYSIGTGNLELTETARGFSDFGEAYGDGDKFFYAITDGTRYEIGSGVLVTGVTNYIERHAIVTSNRNSSNIDFPQGKKEIFVTYPATNAVMMGSGICNHNIPQSNGIAYWESSHTLNYDSSLYWNDTLKRLGIRTNVPEYGIDVQGDGSNQSMIRASGFVVGPTGIHFPVNNGDDSSYDGGIQYKHFLPNTIGDNNINAIIELSGDVNQILKIKSQNAGYFLAGPIPPDGCSSDCGSALPSFRSISMEDLPEGVADNQTTESLQDQIDIVNAEIDTISGVVYGDLQDISRTFEFPVASFSVESDTVSFVYPELANVNIASGYSLNCTIKECTFDSLTNFFLPESVLLHHVNLTDDGSDKYIHFNFYNNEEVIVGGGDSLNDSQHIFAATKPFYVKMHVDIDTENYPVSVISPVDNTATTTTTTTLAPQPATVSTNAVSPFTVNGQTVLASIAETTIVGSTQADSRTFNISLPSNIDNSSNDSVVLQVQKKHPSGELFLPPVDVATVSAGSSYDFALTLPLSSANLSANDTFRTRVSFGNSSTDTNSVNSYSVDIKNTDVLNSCIYHGGQNRFTGVFTDSNLPVESDPPDYSDKYTWFSRPPLAASSFYALTRLPSSINMGHVIYTDCCISNNFFAINHRGDLYAWGENNNGECANGSTSRVEFPQKVASLKFVQVAGARNSAIGLTEDGHIYMWGLINGTNYTEPFLISNTIVFTKISAYDKTYAALDDQGDLYIWGAAQTDNGNTITPGFSNAWINYPSKMEFTPSINIDDISFGMNHLLFRVGSNLYSLTNQSSTLEATDCSTQNDSFSAGNEVSIYANNSDVMLKGQINGTSYSSYHIFPGKGKTIFASKVLNPINNSFATMSNMSVYAAGKNCGFMTPSRYYQNSTTSPYSLNSNSMVLVGEFFPHTFSFFPPYEQGRITLNADNFFFSARKAVYRNLTSTVSTSYVLDTYPTHVYSKSNSATNALSSNWGIMDMVTSGNVSSHYLRHWGVDHTYNPNQSNTPVTTTTAVPTTQPPP